VPRGTLERYVKDTPLSPEELVNVHVGKKTVIPNELENKLLQYSTRKTYSFKETGSKKVIWNRIKKIFEHA
jgi:hypothetical protein